MTYTLKEHGIGNGLLNVMLEIRNDLIQDEQASSRVADAIAQLLRTTLGAGGLQPSSVHYHTGSE